MDLSIIIPAYNSEKTIERCIESIVDEVKSNSLEYEVIVVDDGSVDHTKDVVQRMASCNSCIKYVYQENAGPSRARNTGLSLAQGKYVALNDSDDEWLTGKLRVQLDFLKCNPKVLLVCSNYGKNSELTEPFRITAKKELFHNYFSPQTSVFSVDIAKNYRFDEAMKYSEDMKFFIDILKENECWFVPFFATKNIEGKSSFGQSGLSANLKAMERGELQNLSYMGKLKMAGWCDIAFAKCYSYAKYIRRLILSKRIVRN